MKTIKVLALGGCHIAGYPVGEKYAFPQLFGRLLASEPGETVANIQLASLPQHLARVAEQRPSHVLLQLGNYECADSFRLLLRQLDSPALHKLSASSAWSDWSARSATSSSTTNGDDQTAGAGTTAGAPGWRQTLHRGLRTAGLASLLLSLWVLGRRYRRAFAALNACIAQNPDTVFLCLTPFPSLNPTINTLRRLGGCLMQRRLAAHPNLQWLDTHRLLRPARQLFADESHLNQAAHEVVAHALVTLALRQEAL